MGSAGCNELVLQLRHGNCPLAELFHLLAACVYAVWVVCISVRYQGLHHSLLITSCPVRFADPPDVVDAVGEVRHFSQYHS